MTNPFLNSAPLFMLLADAIALDAPCLSQLPVGWLPLMAQVRTFALCCVLCV
jgi:hypothetical protein